MVWWSAAFYRGNGCGLHPAPRAHNGFCLSEGHVQCLGTATGGTSRHALAVAVPARVVWPCSQVRRSSPGTWSSIMAMSLAHSASSRPCVTINFRSRREKSASSALFAGWTLGKSGCASALEDARQDAAIEARFWSAALGFLASLPLPLESSMAAL